MDEKKAAIGALAALDRKVKATEVVEKMKPGMDPRSVMCTTYQMRNMYEQLGSGYFSSLEIMNYLTHYAAVKRVPGKNGIWYLDLCCGRSLQLPLLRWYKKNLGAYVGVDISLSNLREGMRRSAAHKFKDTEKIAPNLEGQGDPYYPFEVHWLLGNAAELEEVLTEAGLVARHHGHLGMFDHAMFKGIEHMQKEAGIRALEGLWRSMKKGAQTSITSPNTTDKVDEYDTQYAAHLYEWDRNELRDEIVKAGFRVLAEHGMLAKVRGYREKLEEEYPEFCSAFDEMRKYVPSAWLYAVFPIITPKIADEIVLIVQK